MNIFVVIPLFNEEKHIFRVLKDVSVYKIPIVVVDDGSKDKSGFKIRNFMRIHRFAGKNINLLGHDINLGKGAAMKTGADFAFANGADAVGFMDSDGHHNPEDLVKFIRKLEQKKDDVIFGSRNLNLGVPLVRYLGNKFASLLVVLFFRVYVSDTLCGFRAITRKAYGRIKWESSGYGVEMEMGI